MDITNKGASIETIQRISLALKSPSTRNAILLPLKQLINYDTETGYNKNVPVTYPISIRPGENRSLHLTFEADNLPTRWIPSEGVTNVRLLIWNGQSDTESYSFPLDFSLGPNQLSEIKKNLADGKNKGHIFPRILIDDKSRELSVEETSRIFN